jgi:hypothetical protein
MQPDSVTQKQGVDISMGGINDDSKSLDKNVEAGAVSEMTEAPRAEYTEEEERRLVRKIDWLIMPYLWGYATLSAVDVRQRALQPRPITNPCVYRK